MLGLSAPTGEPGGSVINLFKLQRHHWILDSCRHKRNGPTSPLWNFLKKKWTPAHYQRQSDLPSWAKAGSWKKIKRFEKSATSTASQLFPWIEYQSSVHNVLYDGEAKTFQGLKQILQAWDDKLLRLHIFQAMLSWGTGWSAEKIFFVLKLTNTGAATWCKTLLNAKKANEEDIWNPLSWEVNLQTQKERLCSI